MLCFEEKFCPQSVLLDLVVRMEYADGGDLWELIQARYRQGSRHPLCPPPQMDAEFSNLGSYTHLHSCAGR